MADTYTVYLLAGGSLGARPIAWTFTGDADVAAMQADATHGVTPGLGDMATQMVDDTVSPPAIVPITAPDPAILLALTKANRRAYIEAQRDAYIYGGVTYNGHPYQSDPRSQDNVRSWGIVTASGGTVPADFTWRDTANADVPFTASDITNLSAVMASWMTLQYELYWELKAQIDAAGSIDDVNKIVWAVTVRDLVWPFDDDDDDQYLE
jgi:hypothetical protein